MMYANRKVSISNIIVISYAILFASRITVLISSDVPSALWILLEVIYLAIIGFFLFFYPNTNLKIRKEWNSQVAVQIIFLLLTILFGVIFSNSKFKDLIFDHFQSQIIYVLIIIFTAAVVCKYRLLYPVLKISFYILSFYLSFQLITNISELDLSNVRNIFIADSRTRANFGFGHYNNLGNACTCNIMMWLLLKNKKRTVMSKWIQRAFVVISVIMLLSSASRNALTSLVVYVFVLAFLDIDRILKSKNLALLFRALIVMCIVGMAMIVLTDFDFEEFLIASNRITIAKVAIPVLMNSGRILLGLGYASNTAYGTHLTPYTTYWLDNGYVYYLVTTGVVGLLMIVSMIAIIGNGLLKHTDIKVGKQVFALFCMYLYSALFECSLFQSGSVTNYVFLVLFFACIGNYSEFREWRVDVKL